MNKSAIKNFAMRARNNLMAAVEQKAFEIGITKNGIKDIETFQGGFRVNDRVFKASEVEQRKKLIQKIREKGFDQVIEEVAYTWFNRFIALRFMEVNEYLPTGVRVLSSTDTNKTEPDIIREALNIELDIDKNVVYQYQDKNDTEGLFKYLLIKQCNELAKIMPIMFEEIEDYTELLQPDHLLTEGSVIRDLVESIEEDDFKEQVEIIGWLYQYYISEKKDEVFEGLKNNIKITKENIPAATQLFTPDWIVKYMVENSLGRLWLESHPNEELKAAWKYYLEEVEQEPDVQKQLEEIRNKDINPEEIKVLDPAMGSGHILVYAFDVLYEIYKSAGYPEREIPKLILEKNLYGLDIDDRAGQLAYFALMMKARSKNRRIFKDSIVLNICSVQESNGFSQEAIDLLVSNKEIEIEKVIHRQEVEYLVNTYIDAKEYGSILQVGKIDFDAIEKRVEEIRDGNYNNLLEYRYRNEILEKVPALINQARIMSQKYDVVCTNPPYMGNKGMNTRLANYINEHYKNAKNDLYSVFIMKGFDYIKNNGFNAMVTMHSWMFLSVFEEFRLEILSKNSMLSILHLGMEAFENIIGKVVQTVAFCFRKNNILDIKPISIRLVDFYDSKKYEKESQYFNIKNRYSKVKQSDFSKIPGTPIAYWVTEKILETYQKGKMLGSIAEPKTGMTTADNDRFLRLWTEVDYNKVDFNCSSKNDAIKSGAKWFPYSKGGGYRKWKGFDEYVVNWENNGYEIKNNIDKHGKKLASVRSEDKYFLKCITWSSVTSYKFSSRTVDGGHLFDSGGSSLFLDGDNNYIQGLLNSKLTDLYLSITNNTINFQPGDIAKIPVVYPVEKEIKDQIESRVSECLIISKNDWDSFETSWDFLRHPLLSIKDNLDNVADTFTKWSNISYTNFSRLKLIEEELNSKFIQIYGLQEELDSIVQEKDVTVSKADREQIIKSFILYAVGCMFGRYSLDQDSIIYAGGEWKPDNYNTLKPVADNIIPIVDDAYFENDIVNYFIDFLKLTFGTNKLEENLDYIAETLNKKLNETSRQTIRRYFLNDFYKDHVQTYKKRPIYWLFDSGKQNGFKALIYMHRYDPYTVARVRTDYLHKLQKKYDAEINRLDILLESNVSQAEKTKARKKKEDLIKKVQECMAYDQAIAHVASQKIEIDLDDGVAANYAKFQDVGIPQGEGKKPIKADLLAKI